VDYSHIPRILLKNVYCAISVCAKAAKQGDAFSYLVTKTNKRTKNTKELKIQTWSASGIEHPMHHCHGYRGGECL
jgi:hypothetical protein